MASRMDLFGAVAARISGAAEPALAEAEEEDLKVKAAQQPRGLAQCIENIAYWALQYYIERVANNITKDWKASYCEDDITNLWSPLYTRIVLDPKIVEQQRIEELENAKLQAIIDEQEMIEAQEMNKELKRIYQELVKLDIESTKLQNPNSAKDKI